MENKVYVLKILAGKKNPWNNEYITVKQLVILFRMADKEIMMDRKFEGTVDIFRRSDAFTGKFGKKLLYKNGKFNTVSKRF